MDQKKKQNQRKHEIAITYNNISQEKLQINLQGAQRQFDDLKKMKILDVMIKQPIRKNSKKLPTVRQLIQAISTSDLNEHKTNQRQVNQNQNEVSHSSINFLQNSQTTQITAQQSMKRIKSISRLFQLKSKQIQKIKNQNQNQSESDVIKAIYQTIDQIHNSKNSNAFYSQSHFSKRASSVINSTIKLKNKKQNTNFQKLVYLDSKYVSSKINQNEDSFHEKIKKNKSFSKLNEEMNKKKAQEGYFNAIKEMNVKQKPQEHRKNIYHTIDPDKTQKWFYSIQNSTKKISHLLKQKQNVKSKLQQNFSNYRLNNDVVSKLLNKSRTNVQNQKASIEQIAKIRKKHKTLIVPSKQASSSIDYKRKEKQYFRIELMNSKKKSLSQNEKSLNLVQILPKIKAYGKYNF